MPKCSPQTVQHNRLLKRLNISPRHRLCYVNNPKVASSTIKLSLQRAELGDRDFMPQAGLHKRAASPLLTWPDVKAYPLPELMARCFVFSFVRNPYDRLRSVYVNKILHPRQNGAFRVRAGLDRKAPPDFNRFIRAITDQDPVQADPHWRPQHLNLECGKIRYDMIGRLEEFPDDWSSLAQRAGLSLQPCRVGRRTDTVPYPEIIFSDAMIRRIQRSYARDFQLFGYDTTPP